MLVSFRGIGSGEGPTARFLNCGQWSICGVEARVETEEFWGTGGVSSSLIGPSV